MPLCSCSLPALGCLSGEEGPACLPELGSHGSLAVRAVRRRCATERAYPCNVPQSMRTHAMCHRACVPMPMQCATERAYPVLRGEVELRQSLLVLGPRCSVIGPGSSASVLGPGPWALGPGWVPSLQGGLSCLTVLRAACPASQC